MGLRLLATRVLAALVVGATAAAAAAASLGPAPLRVREYAVPPDRTRTTSLPVRDGGVS